MKPRFYPVILSGGSGTRLWPMSRKLLPKQFLALLSEHTLFQETALRVQPMEGCNAPIVVCNDDQRFLLDRTLRLFGHEVRTARSGAEALALLDGVDLVLLDYRLPDMSGIDVLTAIREQHGPAVVMVTAMGSEGVAVEAMRMGALDYVVKDAEYLTRIPQAIERAARHRDVSRRAGELQRLALLVHSALDRAAICREIVDGARELLRADSAALFVVNQVGAVEMLAGDRVGGAATAARVAVLLSQGVVQQTVADDRSLLVRLPGHQSERLGALAVWNRAPREYLPEEVALAETFAAFAGTALANAARLELERALVAELQETLDLRRSLVMSLSHELRTPLTCVLGFADTLLSNWERLDERARLDCVAAIHDNAGELRSLVEQLLDYAALEAGRLSATPADVDLGCEVQATIEALAPLLGDRPVQSDVGERRVAADPALLRRTLSNLLSNAAKHTGPGVPVSVHATDQGPVVRIDVVDHGAGLTDDEAARAFEPFWRSSGAQLKATRGSGIGLALVREYVRMMDGEVGVVSSPGSGSRFWFTLPRAD
jgi:signal transduction histidine kinase